MTRDLILGTAGHIDHGKTSLVKALTGVDCDRLPEEKKRGITIDIGFASLDLGEYRLGLVDVPGHERFIKNMLAGASGVDIALLVIAADDSVMPQTREHLEILQLLGLKHGLIAITKADLIDETMRELVEMEVRELVQGTFLEDSPLVHTSAPTGQGIEELKSEIATLCKSVEEKTAQEWFRLAIDRSFIVQGQGTVVTGSVIGGTLNVGDELEWLPRMETVRVRSLHNHDQPQEAVHRGQRAAINLAGIRHEDVYRGQEIARTGYLKPSRALTIRLHCLKSTRKPLKHRLPVRFHVGTAESMCTLSLLDCDVIKPGEWALAQVFLEEPVTAVWGQPFVIRSSSATHTLGGGQVLQPTAKKVRRRHFEMLERIETLWSGSAEERALTVAWFSGFSGFTHADLVRGANIEPDRVSSLVEKLKEEGQLQELVLGGSRRLLMHHEMQKELESRLVKGLTQLHDQHPLMSGHDRQKVQSLLDYVGEDALISGLVDRLLDSGEVIANGRRIALASFKPKLSNNQRRLKQKIIDAYKAAEFQPPEPSSFANQAGGNRDNLQNLFEVCFAEGELVRISDDVVLHEDAEAEMRARVLERLSQSEGLTVAEIRDLLGTTRKNAVPFCEYLDSVGVTRREGDLRVASESPTTSEDA